MHFLKIFLSLISEVFSNNRKLWSKKSVFMKYNPSTYAFYIKFATFPILRFFQQTPTLFTKKPIFERM